jgi:hypothetical protein
MKYTKEYRVRLLDPESWKQTARQLIEAAALLEPKIDEFWKHLGTQRANASSWRPWNDEFVAIYFMLCAYAIENLLKAQIIQKKKPKICAQIDAKPTLPKVLIGHDLYRLTIEAGFLELAKEEEMLLRRLSRCSVWYGRYPVPLTTAALQTIHPSENYDFDISLTAYTSTDRQEIQRIVQRLS